MDLFAAGIILFIMYKGGPPFYSTKPDDKIYKMIREKKFPQFWKVHEKGKPPGFFPEEFKALMNSFFSADPHFRPTLESLAHDPWLNAAPLPQEAVLA